MNLKSSWLLEPFMVNDWEKLREKRGEFRTPGACGPAAAPPPGPP